MNTLVVEQKADIWRISIKGKDLTSMGRTVPEAVGNLLILYGNQLGIKLEARKSSREVQLLTFSRRSR
jgi:hypothetical protein